MVLFHTVKTRTSKYTFTLQLHIKNTSENRKPKTLLVGENNILPKIVKLNIQSFQQC